VLTDKLRYIDEKIVVLEHRTNAGLAEVKEENLVSYPRVS
jgi:hypothetical protein